MGVYISNDELQQFYDNGITHDDIENTVDYYRNEGLSDEQIRAKVDTKLKSFNPQKNADMPQDSLEGNGSETQPFQLGVSKNIDLRPSALADNIAKHIVALPIAGYNAIKNKSFKGAYSSALNDLDEAKQKIYELDPTQKKIDNAGNALLDIGTTLMLPEVRALQGAGLGAKIGNSALTNAYQGGLIGGVEDLRHGGNGLGGATIGALGGGAFGVAMPAAGAGINKMITSPKFQKGLSGALEVLTSVPQKYNLRALEAELAGKSLFEGKFDPDTAYRPIEQMLKDAKSKLISKQDYKKQYKLLGNEVQQRLNEKIKPENYYNNQIYEESQKAFNSLKNYKNMLEQNVNEAVNKLRENEYRVPLDELKSDIKGTFDQYQGENINPARNMTGGLERNLNELVTGGTSDPKAALGLDKEITTNFIDNPYFSKEKQAEAYDIVGRALGKDKNWVKSRLNDPQYRGVKTQSEKLDMLLRESENLAEKEANTGELGSQAYKYYDYLGDSGSPEAAEELINRAYNDIVNNNFVTDNIDPLTRNINDAEMGYRELLNRVINNSGDSASYNNAVDEIERLTQKLPQDLQEEYFNRLGKDLNTIYNKTQTISPIDLQATKKQVDSMIHWEDEAARNFKNPILEQIYGKFNQRLSDLSPELAKANEEYANFRNLEKAVNEINEKTIATKLEDYGNKKQIFSGANKAWEKLNDLLPVEKQFLPNIRNLQKNNNFEQGLIKDVPKGIFSDISKYENAPIQTQSVIEQVAPNEIALYKQIAQKEAEQNELLRPIASRSFERNPRLLGNRSDQAFEDALNYLQSNSDIRFMDNLEDIRAREALEKIAPGQGGGSGNDQGFMNNFVRPTLNALPRAASSAVIGNSLGGPIGGAIGLLSVSPKFMGKGTIKNIGAIYKRLNQKPVPIPSEGMIPEHINRSLIKYLYGATRPFSD